MSAMSSVAVGKANEPATEAGPSSPQSGAIMGVFGNLFPDDTVKILARFLGLSYGGAKKKLEGERDLSLPEFITLLRTENGFRILTAAMADSQVKWWRVCRPLMDVAEVAEMQIAARKKLRRAIKGAFDADADLSASIARADALLVQDQDFYREHADAQRAMAGPQDRAVAKGRQR